MDPRYRKYIYELEQKLEAAHREIDKLRHDTVSGLLGRQGFEDSLEALFHLRRSDDGLLGVIMCDIDDFKSVNDEYGHHVGDDIIGQVAGKIAGCVRTSDVAARYGGEEFVCVVARADVVGLAILAERLRRAVEEMDTPGNPKVTISVGFALQKPEEDRSAWAIVERADAALYRAKQAGRNRVEHEPLGEELEEALEKLGLLMKEETE